MAARLRHRRRGPSVRCRLEWIIIVLIVIEIGLDLLKEIELGPVGLVTGLVRRVVLRRGA